MPRVSVPQWLRKPYVIDTIDPSGKQVICSDGYWLAHISSKHTAMKGRQQQVAAVIRSPESIYQDSTFPNRRIHYRHGILPAPFDSATLKVVIEYPIMGIGRIPPAAVITAYPVDAPRKGEQLIWPLPVQLPLP